MVRFGFLIKRWVRNRGRVINLENQIRVYLMPTAISKDNEKTARSWPGPY